MLITYILPRHYHIYKLVCRATPHPVRGVISRVPAASINNYNRLSSVSFFKSDKLLYKRRTPIVFRSIFCYYTEFPSCPKRVASSRSKADNQKTVNHNTLQPNRNKPHYYWRGHLPTGVPPYPPHTLHLDGASLSVSLEQGKVNITFSLD